MSLPPDECVLIVARGELATLTSRALAPRFHTILATSIADGLALLAREPRIAAVGVATTLDDGAFEDLLASAEAEDAGRPIFLIADAADADAINSACSHAVPVAVWPFDAACIEGLIATAQRRHQAYVAREVRDAFTEAVHPSTPWNREDEVCWQTVLGAMPKDIASDRGMKDKTVYGIRDRVRQRLGVGSLSDLRQQILQSVLPEWRTKK